MLINVYILASMCRAKPSTRRSFCRS